MLTLSINIYLSRCTCTTTNNGLSAMINDELTGQGAPLSGIYRDKNGLANSLISNVSNPSHVSELYAGIPTTVF